MSSKDARARARAALDAHRTARDSIASLDAARRLCEAAEQLQAAAIEAARADGATWAEIGDVYGLTKQGAQQRFREKPAKPSKKG